MAVVSISMRLAAITPTLPFAARRIGNVNVGSSGFNNLTIEPRTGSDAPVILWHQDQAGSNSTTVWGGLTLNGNAQFDIPHVFQVNGGISGTGTWINTSMSDSSWLAILAHISAI